MYKFHIQVNIQNYETKQQQQQTTQQKHIMNCFTRVNCRLKRLKITHPFKEHIRRGDIHFIKGDDHGKLGFEKNRTGIQHVGHKGRRGGRAGCVGDVQDSGGKRRRQQFVNDLTPR